MKSLFDERSILGDIEFYELIGQFQMAQKLRSRYLKIKALNKKAKIYKMLRKKLSLKQLKSQERVLS